MSEITNEQIMLTSDLTDGVSTYADNQSYFPIGKGGRLNLNTGEISYFNDEIKVGGEALPFSLSYNFIGGAKKWKLSTSQSLSFLETPILQAYFCDSIDNMHYFEDVGDGSGLGKDYSGLDLTLNGSYGYGDSYIYDTHGNQLIFNSNNQLYKIIDNNGNYITIEGYPATKIIDSFGRVTNIEYTNGLMTRIIDYAGRNTVFEYDSNKNLIKITDPDGHSVEFFDYFDIGGFLGASKKSIGKIKEKDGITYVFTYSGSKVTKLEKFAVGSVIDTDNADETITFEYDSTYGTNFKTIVNDRTHIRNVYLFDEGGRVANMYKEMPVVVDGEEVPDRYKVATSVNYQYSDKKRTFSMTVDQNNDEINLVKNGSGNVTSSEAFDNDNLFHFKKIYSDDYYLRIFTFGNRVFNSEELGFNNGNIFLLSAWLKKKTDFGKFKLCAKVTYEDNSTEEFSVDYVNQCVSWQYTAVPIVVNRSKTVENIEIFFKAYDLLSFIVEGYVDNIRLINAPANFVTYEKNLYNVNEVVFGKNFSIKEKVKSYDGKSEIIQLKNVNHDIVKTTIVDAEGNEFSSYAEYDDKHNLIYSQDYRGIITKYTYNSVGMVTSVKTWYCPEINPSKIADPKIYFLKTMTYDETWEFLIRENDPRGDYIYTTNEYDTTKCLLNSTTAPNGQKTSYTYDPNNDLVTKVSAMVDENEYSVLYGYTNRRLTSITHNGFNYGFTYDGMGRAKDVKIARTTYSTNDYLLTDTTTVTTTYATGEKMKVETDRFNQPIKTTYIDSEENSEVLLQTQYDSFGRVKKAIDKVELMTYNYKYDGFGNVIEYEDNNNSIINTFDSNNRLTEKQMFFGGEYFTITPTYEKDLDGKVYPDNVITELAYDNGITSKNKRDAYGRISEKQVDFGENSNVITESYRYLKAPNDDALLLTNMVRSITYNHGENEETIKYTYDNNGNITCVTKGFDVLVRYEYDEMNQLIREDNKQLNRSYLYRYDNAGNIILKDEHEYIYGEETATLSRKEYTYSDTGWKDKLISFGGQSITYDALGNPLSYLGHTLTWDRVRQLKTFDNNTFAYDGFGKRCRKNSVYYLYDSDKLIKERRNGTSLVYFYDTNGICGFRYNVFTGGVNSTDYYFYRKNHQGDVTAILDQNGNIVAEYLYDAWGKCYITYDPTGIGEINPIRYRSYYFDTETGLYYLNSRYYDPNTGRFLNADIYVSTGQGILGNNMFAYCGNDPINRFDFFGTSWKHWFIGAAVVAACALATVATCGGFAAAATAVGMVASGGAAFTVSSTIAASAFIGTSMSYGSAVCYSAFNSDSIEDFAESGNTDVIITTATAGALYSIAGYNTAKNQLPDTKKYSETTGTARPPKVSEPNSRYIQYDQNTGKVRTDAVYGNDGNLYSRVDYLHTHNINGINVQPHIHFSPAINSQGLPVGRATVMPW